jgi:hypothetical protein
VGFSIASLAVAAVPRYKRNISSDFRSSHVGTRFGNIQNIGNIVVKVQARATVSTR